MFLHRTPLLPNLCLIAFASAGSFPGAFAQRPAAPAPTGDGHTWRLKRQEQTAPLTDWRTGQTRTYRMVSMLVPEGWSMTPAPGETFGKIDCANQSSRFLLSSVSPDKSTGVVVLPAQATMWSTNQNYLQQSAAFARQWKASACTIRQPQSFADGLREGASKLMPGAQTGPITPVPELSAALPGIVAGANRQLEPTGAHIDAEAGRIHLTGNLQGHAVEAYMVAMRTIRTTTAPGGGQVFITDYPLVALIFAPPGQLEKNEKLLSTVLASVEVAPEWFEQGQGYVAATIAKIQGAQQEVARIHANMARDNANAAAQQQAIRSNAANYRSNVISAVAANRSAALDHSSQQFSLYMGDQAIYKDPSTGQRVQMSSGYNHVWASTTGNTSDYILTDSPSYNPNGQAGSASWSQMEIQH